jgi:hypothetical protein
MLWLLQEHQPVNTNSCPHFNTSYIEQGPLLKVDSY